MYEDMSSRSSSRIVKQIKKDKNIFIHDYGSFVIDSSFTIYLLLLLANGVTLKFQGNITKIKVVFTQTHGAQSSETILT